MWSVPRCRGDAVRCKVCGLAILRAKEKGSTAQHSKDKIPYISRSIGTTTKLYTALYSSKDTLLATDALLQDRQARIPGSRAAASSYHHHQNEKV